MKYFRQTCCVIAAVLIFVMLCIPVSAQGAGSDGAGPGSGPGYGGVPAAQGNDSLAEPVQIREQTSTRIQECDPDEACNATRLRAMVEYRNQVNRSEADGAVPQANAAVQAAYAFRAAAPLTGVHSSDLVRLAEEINGSVKETIRNEEQIRSRNAFMVFLFGGDHASADAIMQHVVQNRVRIEEMNRLIGGCGCDPETSAILRERVEAMEQEQARFEELAVEEKEKRGLFGFFG